MNKIKKQQTVVILIVLAVTIIISLILAGISRSRFTKNNEATIQAKLTLTYKNTEQKTGKNVANVVDKNVPIPTNFYYVGGTKDTGVVISDDGADENKGVDSNLRGNQFVWVPVNQNQKLQIDVTSKNNISSVSLKDPFGEEMLIESNVGKTYNKKDQEPTVNGTYSLTITTTTGETKTTKLAVHSLYKQDFLFLDIDLSRATIETELKEMAEIEGFSSLEDYAKSMNFETVEKMIEDHINQNIEECKNYTDNDANQESVNTYGGFYIARYEAGDGEANGTPRSSSSSKSNTVVSKKGAIVYNYISQPDSITRAESMYTGKSKLISGAGWDRTLNWLIETKAKTENEIFVDSSSWGNYSNSAGDAKTNSGEGNMNFTTGRNASWKANNIYDFAGNVEEWTTEAYCSDIRVLRGGDYNCTSVLVSNRVNVFPYDSYIRLGFRPVLYL